MDKKIKIIFVNEINICGAIRSIKKIKILIPVKTRVCVGKKNKIFKIVDELFRGAIQVEKILAFFIFSKRRRFYSSVKSEYFCGCEKIFF